MRVAIPGRVEESKPTLVQHGGVREPSEVEALLPADEGAREEEAGKNLIVVCAGSAAF
jgi:hypothetical protein